MSFRTYCHGAEERRTDLRWRACQREGSSRANWAPAALHVHPQIVGLIQRRQEYVQKNIETVQRQFFDAEAKSEELAFAAANQSSKSQGGLPLTEIQEELDGKHHVEADVT